MESKLSKKKTGPQFAIYEDGKIITITNPRQQELSDKLPPGVYRVEVREGFFGPPTILFHREELASERYVDLGGPAGRVVSIGKQFFAGEHKESLARHGMLNKVFMLLHGPPGTGKTLVANEVARIAVENGAVVLRHDEMDNDGLNQLHQTIEAIRTVTPDQVVMIQLDDAEGIFGYENLLLAMLDGDRQQNNVLWTVTTNHPTHVPERLMGRTRRITFHFPFGPPSAPMRRRYLAEQGIEGEDLEQYVIATKGKTIDQIAGLVNSTLVFRQPADEVLQDVDLREKVRTGKLDYSAYMENYYGEEGTRNVAAAPPPRGGQMDASKRVDEIGEAVLDEFEKQQFEKVGYDELRWLQAAASNKLYAAMIEELLPPYRTAQGQVRAVDPTSDVEVVYWGDLVRLTLRFYSSNGVPEKRYYRRKLRPSKR